MSLTERKAYKKLSESRELDSMGGGMINISQSDPRNENYVAKCGDKPQQIAMFCIVEQNKRYGTHFELSARIWTAHMKNLLATWEPYQVKRAIALAIWELPYVFSIKYLKKSLQELYPVEPKPEQKSLF